MNKLAYAYADDRLSLSELHDLAQNDPNLGGGNDYWEWMEDYYDPARSALLHLLVDYSIIEPNPKEEP